MGSRKAGCQRTSAITAKVNLGQPELILCAGLKSSGSTWLYNVVSKILKEGHRQKPGGPRSQRGKLSIMTFYADSVSAFPPQAAKATHLVIKTHVPDESLVILTRFSHARVFLTVREPRDSVASVMQRFGHNFSQSLGELAMSSARLAALCDSFDPVIFHYEERFFDNPQTVARIAKSLGVSLGADGIQRVFEQHTRVRVKRQIQNLERRGAFGTVAHPDRFDPVSHWHPGHVGDTESGKFARVLTSSQQRAVLSVTTAFRGAFGYLQRTAPRSAGVRVRDAARKGNPRWFDNNRQPS